MTMNPPPCNRERARHSEGCVYACCFAGAQGMGRSHGRMVHIGPGAMGSNAADELHFSTNRLRANNVTHVDDVPVGLSDKNVRAYQRRHARSSPILEAAVTAALPQLQRHIEWCPSTVEALLSPHAWARVKLFESNTCDLEWMREHGANDARPHEQQPLALAQSVMVPGAQGIVRDLRRANDGIIEPWLFTSPIKSDLILAFLRYCSSRARAVRW